MMEQSVKRLNHLAFIMDGNGRWAEQRGLSRDKGHERGYEVFSNLLDYLITLSIPEVSFFALSSENLDRPPHELACLMALFVQAAREGVARWQEASVAVRVIGSRDRLSAEVCDAIASVEARNPEEYRMQVNICFAFGGQWHIEQAFLKTKHQDLEAFRAALMAPFRYPMDCVIRTGGMCRISNFALWQLAYAEFMFLNDFWPDMTEAKLDACLLDFDHRERRFGRIYHG